MTAPEDRLSPRLELSFSLAFVSLIFFTAVLPGVSAGLRDFFPPWLFLLMMTVPVQAANIASCLIPVWRYSPRLPLRDALDLKLPEGKDLETAVFGTLIVYFGLAFVTGITVDLLRRIGIEPQEQEAVTIFRSGTFLEAAILIPCTVILAPLGEEFCFRYALFRKPEQHLGYLPAALIASLIFAAAHLNLQVMPALFLLGLWLSWLYRRTGSLLAPMLAHALFNAMSILLIYVIGQ